MTLPFADTVYDTPGLNSLTAGGGWSAALVALGFAAVSAAVVGGWRERGVAPKGWGWLLSLRLGAIAAIFGLVAGLERRQLSERDEPSRVVLLVDSSASMRLPANEETSTAIPRNAAVQAAIDQLAGGFGARHEVRRAAFDVAVDYIKTPAANDGEATRLGTALGRVLSDYGATPLAAIVVASDGGWNAGPDPMNTASTARARGVPVHTLGIGPLTQPPSIGIRDLAMPARASVGDRFRVAVTLSSNAAAPADTHRVTLQLRRQDESGSPGPIAFETDLSISSEPGGGLTVANTQVEAELEAGTYQLVATLTPPPRDANPDDNRLTAEVELFKEPTRVLLVAGGPARDYRFLRDQLFRDDLFACDVLLQSAAGAVTQDADTVLDAPPADADGWDAYDTLVAIDVDWGRFAEAELAALAEWVSRRGGGMVFVAGPVYTPPSVRRGLPEPLRVLMPITLRDDPMAFSVAIEASREARPVRPTAAGRDADFLTAPAGLRWEDFDGFYATPLPADIKSGATVLARLGDRGDDSPPLAVEQFYGAGRVAYVASTESWRLRKATPEWFSAWHTNLLRRVAQGRVRGGAAEGSLLLDRTRYDLGDIITFRFVARSLDSEAKPDSLVARIAAADEDPEEVTLSAIEGQPGVYTATRRAEAVGELAVSLVTPSGARLEAAAQVTLPSLEGATVVQNAGLLKAIAEGSGGRYIELNAPDAEAALAELVATTPSLAETTIELDPPDQRFARRVANGGLAAMAGCLLLEWALRRSWRLA